MRILSLDASTRSTGFAIFDDKKLEEYGVLTASSTDLIKRINKIITGLEQVLTRGKIDQIIIEEVRPEQGKNLQTYRALMWLQAAINFLVHEKFPKIKIEYIYPNEWRKACGIKTGAGVRREDLKKKDIAFALQTYGYQHNIDDEADAICIGHAYVNQLNNEINWE